MCRNLHTGQAGPVQSLTLPRSIGRIVSFMTMITSSSSSSRSSPLSNSRLTCDVRLFFSPTDPSRPVLGCSFQVVILLFIHDVINHLLSFTSSSSLPFDSALYNYVKQAVMHAARVRSSCAYAGGYRLSYSFLHVSCSILIS